MPEGIPFGEYRLLRRLGAGGMAEVYLAKKLGPRGFEKQLVIKRILPHLSASERFTALFLKEARLAALIDHPNLVHVSSFGEIDGDYYLAMEFVDGITVADVLGMFGTLTAGVTARISIDLCSALGAIHSAVDGTGKEMELVHRDVTPRNVMLTRDANVKLLDFGIAVSREETVVGSMGTRRHMSPEQMRAEAVDHRSDLFSLGVLMYMMLTGEPPFDGLPEGPAKRPAAIPDALWSTIEKALSLDPNGRHANARQVQAELELFVASLGLEGTRAHLAEVVSTVIPGRRPLARALSAMTSILKLTAPLDEEDNEVAPPPKPRTPNSLLRLSFMLSGMMFAAAIGVYVVKVSTANSTIPLPDPTLEEVAPETVAVTSSELEPEPEPEREKVHVRDLLPETQQSPQRSGTLVIDTKPWSEVFLASKSLGITPLVNIKLPVGTHQLELRNASLGLTKRIKVVIRPGKVTRVQRDL